MKESDEDKRERESLKAFSPAGIVPRKQRNNTKKIRRFPFPVRLSISRQTGNKTDYTSRIRQNVCACESERIEGVKTAEARWPSRRCTGNGSETPYLDDHFLAPL